MAEGQTQGASLVVKPEATTNEEMDTAPFEPIPFEPTEEVEGEAEPTVEMDDHAPVVDTAPPEQPMEPLPEVVADPPAVAGAPASDGVREEKYETGDFYRGTFNGELREGKGLYVYAEGPIKEFEGDFKAGWGHGLGRFKFSDGGHYEGEVAQGNMHGCGKLVMANGATYTGMFNAGLMDGRGVHVNADGSCTYKGEWAEGKKSGRGMQSSANGDNYDGDWRDNLMHGQGTLRLANGDVYEGAFDKAKRCGYGVMTYKVAPGAVQPLRYVGGWRKDTYHGRGLLTWTDGTKEDAMWKDGHRRAAAGEHLWWDDVCFLCKHSLSPVRNISRMTCCETCPNVAHVECVNTKRVAKGFSTIADPIPAACDYHCCERSAQTGRVCEPAGYAEDAGSWEGCGGTIVATPELSVALLPSPKPDGVRSKADGSGGRMLPTSAAPPGEAKPAAAEVGVARSSGNGGGSAVVGKVGTKISIKAGDPRRAAVKPKECRPPVTEAGTPSEVAAGLNKAMTVSKGPGKPVAAVERVVKAKARGPTASSSSGAAAATATAATAELRRACNAACAAVNALERENARLRASARNGPGGGAAAARASLGAAPIEAPTEAPTLLLTQLTMLHHQTPDQSPESCERLLLLHRDLRRNPWGATLPEGAVMWDCDPAPATEEDLLKVHDEEYLDFMRHKAQNSVFRTGGMSSLSDSESDAPVNETAISTHSVDAIMSAAGCVLRAIDATHERRAKNAFCLVRPPGHHAASEKSLRRRESPLNPKGIGAGFCLVNNVLIGAKYAHDLYGWRVAVVDFDAHHGNGTEQAIRYGKLKDEQSLMLCSIHQYHKDEFPGTGGRENVERNDHGDPWIVNVPIPYTVPKEQRPNADDVDSGVWRQKVVDGVLPYLHEFKADLLLMSAGFDAHKDDPVGHMKLVEEDFEWITKALVSSAAGATVPHVVSVLEGGYGIDAHSRFSLSRACCAHVAALTQLGSVGSAAALLSFDADAARAIEALSFRCGVTSKNRINKGKRDASTDDLHTMGPARHSSPSKRPRPF